MPLDAPVQPSHLTKRDETRRAESIGSQARTHRSSAWGWGSPRMHASVLSITAHRIVHPSSILLLSIQLQRPSRKSSLEHYFRHPSNSLSIVV